MEIETGNKKYKVTGRDIALLALLLVCGILLGLLLAVRSNYNSLIDLCSKCI